MIELNRPGPLRARQWSRTRPRRWHDSRCRCHSRRGSRCGCGCDLLHFKRSDIDSAASYTIKPWTTLVVKGRIKVGFARIDSRAADHQRQRKPVASMMASHGGRGAGLGVLQSHDRTSSWSTDFVEIAKKCRELSRVSKEPSCQKRRRTAARQNPLGRPKTFV
jgi:hypothetical protein